METTTSARARLIWALAGLGATVLGGLLLEAWAARIGPAAAGTLAYPAAWLPMLAALYLAYRQAGFREAFTELGLRVHPLDIFWGLAIGCGARAADSLLRLSLTQPPGGSGQPTLGTAIAAPALVTGIIAPVIIAPVVEELFFRGLIQRTLAAGTRPLALRTAQAVLVTSVAFAAVHVILAARTPTDLITIAAGTFIFSIASGVAAAATGRLGASILGHVTFNGLGVWLAWPA